MSKKYILIELTELIGNYYNFLEYYTLIPPDEEAAASQTHISFVSNDFARKPAVSQTLESNEDAITSFMLNSLKIRFALCNFKI